MVDRKSLALGAGSFIALLAGGLLAGGLAGFGPAAVAVVSPYAAPIPVIVPQRVANELAVRPAAAAPGTHAEWGQRLARQDEILVEQAVAAGCDADRAEKLRELLLAKGEHRARTIAATEAGTLTREEMQASARAAKASFDSKLKEILRPDELRSLDPGAARARVVAEEKKGR